MQTSFNITRDLHCFSMSASLSPFGTWKYYSFVIRANASILQDLKYDKKSQTQTNINGIKNPFDIPLLHLLFHKKYPLLYC